MSDRPTGPLPSNDVYTVLLMLATALVLAATLYLGIQSQHLFGTWNPFS